MLLKKYKCKISSIGNVGQKHCEHAETKNDKAARESAQPMKDRIRILHDQAKIQGYEVEYCSLEDTYARMLATSTLDWFRASSLSTNSEPKKLMQSRVKYIISWTVLKLKYPSSSIVLLLSPLRLLINQVAKMPVDKKNQ
jgi:hypothetical protein